MYFFCLGQFQHVFNTNGKYYLVTDVLDNENWGTIYMHMAVEVIDRQTELFELNVHAFGVDADLDICK